MRDSVELLFVEDAEMVFTTLSSTGRKVFGRLSPGHFETVLIDEAAQASEVTTLQALTFGCRRSVALPQTAEPPCLTCVAKRGANDRVVLVGDPQQLPATVLSQRGKELLLERSLFERLQQAGCPVHMLQVQYRMHPSIRDFPSAHFYDSKLQDGSVLHPRPAYLPPASRRESSSETSVCLRTAGRRLPILAQLCRPDGCRLAGRRC